jgi:integrase
MIKWSLAKENPMSKIDMLSEDNIITRVLSREEIKRILNESAHRKDLTLFVKMALYMGMRKEEILSLQLPEKDLFAYKQKAHQKKINWIDMENGMIVLNNTKNRRGREVPINDEVHNDLQEYAKERPPGSLFDYKDLRRQWEKARKKANITDCTFHDLRRTFISYLASAGISREIVQSICGQVSEQVYKRYAHISTQAKKQTVKQIGSIMAEENKTTEQPKQ